MEAYQRLTQKVKSLADVQYATAVLHWDQEVMMPPRGAQRRAEQIASLSALAHSLFTDAEMKELLDAVDTNALADDRARINVIRLKEDYKKATKLSTAFVHEQSLLVSNAYQAWIAARQADDFSLYKDTLGKLIKNKQEEAQLRGYQAHPYDALLDTFESGLNCKMLDQIFDDVKENIIPLSKQIPHYDVDGIFEQQYPEAEQWIFANQVLRDMGYDFDAGRHDKSEHSFTINFSQSDVRITTRLKDYDYSYMLWSSIHEGGHALYEQGLDDAQYGLPCGAAASLSIHESQSRLWENQIARSQDFWAFYYPILQKMFSAQLKHVEAEQFLQAVNRVAPNLIRTEADEIHYHIHILIRYEIEKSLIDGSLHVDELESTWNARYKAYMGLGVPSAREGVLQDIHWAHGSFGYFPTYSLGSFYAAQFFEQANQDLPNLKTEIRAGDFSNFLQWLRTNIHQYGRQYLSEELCTRVCGEGLNVQHFVNYIKVKYGISD